MQTSSDRLLVIAEKMTKLDDDKVMDEGIKLCKENMNNFPDDFIYLLGNNGELYMYGSIKYEDIGIFSGKPKYPHFKYDSVKILEVCSIIALRTSSV